MRRFMATARPSVTRRCKRQRAEKLAKGLCVQFGCKNKVVPNKQECRYHKNKNTENYFRRKEENGLK